MARSSGHDEVDSVAWAHLSDFHFKIGQDYGRDEVLQALLRDLEMFAGQHEPARGAEPVPLDFIVVTGDVAQSGQRDEYDVARRFFDDVSKAAGVPAERIFAVPGNHDVDRRKDARFIREALNGRETFEEAWGNLAARRAVFAEKLAAYRAFATGLNPRLRIPEEQPGGYLHTLDCRGRRVALLGLGSSWRSGAEKERGDLITGKEQAYDLAGGVGFPALAEADLKLALMHHPLEWMQEFDQTELKKLLAENVDLLLRGHLHETVVDLHASPGRVLRTIAAGASYAGSQWRNAYNVARVSFGPKREVKFWLRAYAKGERCFVKDVETYAQAEDGTWTWELAGAARKAPATTARATPDLRPYLAWLEQEHHYLEVRGMGAKTTERVELERVYTRLRVAGPRETDREPRGAKRGEQAELDGAGARDSDLAQLLAIYPSLLLVGDPGAGKTTFLRFVARNLARALLGQEPEDALRAVGLTGEPPLPVFVRLEALADFLRKNPAPDLPEDAPEHLFRHLDHALHGFHLGLDDGCFKQRILDGGCFLLLDGLDEVPGADLRARVGRIVDHVVGLRTRVPNRHLVTARTRAYTQGEVRLGQAFVRADLVDFGPEQVEQFVRQWARALYRVRSDEQGTVAADAAGVYGRELLSVIRAHRSLGPLTANPLLLTVLGVVHWNLKRLPEQRAELYEEAVDYLVASRARQAEEFPAPLRKECLQAIAVRMFEDPAGVRRTLDRVEAAEAVRPLLRVDRRRALAFLEEEELWSGLLVSRREGEVEFWHLTFQEYLAALDISLRPAWWDAVADHLDDDRWSELVLLLAGCLRRLGSRIASTFITRILARDTTLSGQARAVGLIGRILRDILPYGGDPSVGTGYAEALRATLGIFERGSSVGESVRVEVGEALGQAGDPRISDDDHANRVFIVSGTFWMGAQKADRKKPGYDSECFGDEAPVHRVTLSDFWIDRYPVTVQQYRRFVEGGAEGYLDARFWRPEGWSWREGAERKQPDEWEKQLQYPNRPVTYVSWHEAVAYSAWLAKRTGRAVRLPTEAQWEYATRGTEGRKYPWGDAAPTDQHANFSSRVGRPTPVGIYPLGATPEGVQDLSGNVWEWCADWRGAYASEEQTDPNGPANGAARLLRGGGFYHGPRGCRAADRHDGDPELDLDDVGFRCVVLGGRTE